jgi:hypothetical protein
LSAARAVHVQGGEPKILVREFKDARGSVNRRTGHVQTGGGAAGTCIQDQSSKNDGRGCGLVSDVARMGILGNQEPMVCARGEERDDLWQALRYWEW